MAVYQSKASVVLHNKYTVQPIASSHKILLAEAPIQHQGDRWGLMDSSYDGNYS